MWPLPRGVARLTNMEFRARKTAYTKFHVRCLRWKTTSKSRPSPATATSRLEAGARASRLHCRRDGAALDLLYRHEAQLFLPGDEGIYEADARHCARSRRRQRGRCASARSCRNWRRWCARKTGLLGSDPGSRDPVPSGIKLPALWQRLTPVETVTLDLTRPPGVNNLYNRNVVSLGRVSAGAYRDPGGARGRRDRLAASRLRARTFRLFGDDRAVKPAL